MLIYNLYVIDVLFMHYAICNEEDVWNVYKIMVEAKH